MALVPLPQTSVDSDSPTLWAEPRFLPARPLGLPRLEYVRRQGAALHATPLAPQGGALGLNLTRGCVHRCGFCNARAYPSYPGDEVIVVYTETPTDVNAELAAGPKPSAVYISPSTDPFPPLNEIQNLTAEVVEVLAGHGVAAWLMTRGWVRPAVAERLAGCSPHVRVTVAMTTVDRGRQRLLEPLSAPPSLRLRQIRELRDRGVSVLVSLDPLLPGITDTRENLEPLLEALAGAGVTQVSASYLFLREAIVEQLRRTLEPGGAEVIVGEFRGGPVLAPPGLAAARYLPRGRRQRGYSLLMALAATRGIHVTVSRLTNPDFVPPRPAKPVVRTSPRLLHRFLTTGNQPEQHGPPEPDDF